MKQKIVESELTTHSPKTHAQNLRFADDQIDHLQDGNVCRIENGDKEEHQVSLESNMNEFAIRSHDQRGKLIPVVNLNEGKEKKQVEKKRS